MIMIIILHWRQMSITHFIFVRVERTVHGHGVAAGVANTFGVRRVFVVSGARRH